MGDSTFACKKSTMSADGLPEALAAYPGDQTGPQKRLINYWIHEAGINWGAPGGFTRCVAKLGPKLAANSPGVDVKGMCANLHKAATGKWPSEHRPGSR